MMVFVDNFSFFLPGNFFFCVRFFVSFIHFSLLFAFVKSTKAFCLILNGIASRLERIIYQMYGYLMWYQEIMITGDGKYNVTKNQASIVRGNTSIDLSQTKEAAFSIRESKTINDRTLHSNLVRFFFINVVNRKNIIKIHKRSDTIYIWALSTEHMVQMRSMDAKVIHDIRHEALHCVTFIYWWEFVWHSVK